MKVESFNNLNRKMSRKSGNLSEGNQKTDNIYILGGQNSTGGDIRDMEKYSLTSKTWNHVGLMKDRRSYYCACELNGNIYILGGKGANKQLASTIHKYSPGEMRWEELTLQLIIPRSAFGVAVCGNKIYSVGGYGTSEASNSIEFIDTHRNFVELLQEKFSHPRWGHGVTVCQNKIYVIGGQWYDPNVTGRRSQNRYYPHVECFDVIRRKWTSCVGMLRRRAYHGVATYNDTFIYAVGGVGGELGKRSFSRLNSVERLDTRSPDKWTMLTVTPMLPHMSNFGLCIKGDTIYIIGGLVTHAADPTNHENKEKPQLHPRAKEHNITLDVVHQLNCRNGKVVLGKPLSFPRRTFYAIFCKNIP